MFSIWDCICINLILFITENWVKNHVSTITFSYSVLKKTHHHQKNIHMQSSSMVLWPNTIEKSSDKVRRQEWGMKNRCSKCHGIGITSASPAAEVRLLQVERRHAWNSYCLLRTWGRWSLLFLLWSCGLSKLI